METESLVEGFTQAADQLRAKLSELQRSFEATGSPQGVQLPSLEYKTACSAVAAASLTHEQQRAFESAHTAVLKEWTKISSPLHEAAHAVVAHALKLGVQRAGLSQPGKAFTDIAPYDPSDGARNLRDMRLVVTLYAGAVGEQLVTVPGAPDGFNGDLAAAAALLTEHGLSVAESGSLLQQAACAMVLVLRPVINRIALALMHDGQIGRQQFVSIYLAHITAAQEETIAALMASALTQVGLVP